MSKKKQTRDSQNVSRTMEQMMAASDFNMDDLSLEDMEEMSKSELKEKAEQFNKAYGLKQKDDAYIAKSQTKSDMIEDFKENWRIGRGDLDVGKQHDMEQTALSNLRTHPQNYRHAVDYEDPNMQASIEDEGGLYDTVVVEDSGKTDDDGNTIWYILSGNRRVHNYKRLCEKKDMDPSEQMVDIKVRTTEGQDRERNIDRTFMIVNANESHEELSPVDKVHAIRDLLSEGMSQKAIAEKMQVSSAYISKLMALDRLPERMLDLIHFHSKQEHFQTLWGKHPEDTRQLLEDNGVEFETAPDGDEGPEQLKQINGITMNNGIHLSRFVKEAVNKIVDQEDFDGEREDALSDVHDFLLDPSIDVIKRDKSGDVERSYSGIIEAAKYEGARTIRQLAEDTAERVELYPIEDTRDVPSRDDEDVDVDATDLADDADLSGADEGEDVDLSGADTDDEPLAQSTDSDRGSDFHTDMFMASAKIDWEATAERSPIKIVQEEDILGINLEKFEDLIGELTNRKAQSVFDYLMDIGLIEVNEDNIGQ